MKIISIFAFLMITFSLFSQKNSNDCYEYMKLEQNEYLRDTTFFTNGSFLFYQWNCDSTWLTFENEERIVLKSCNYCDPILCSRLGLNYVQEYPKYLLFVHNWISGCCTPPDIVFIDKQTGREKGRITHDLFVWGDSEENYTLYFSDTTFRELIYLNHKSGIKFNYSFNEGVVLNSAMEHSVLHISELFKKFCIDNDFITFYFKDSFSNSEMIKFKIK